MLLNSVLNKLSVVISIALFSSAAQALDKWSLVERNPFNARSFGIENLVDARFDSAQEACNAWADGVQAEFHDSINSVAYGAPRISFSVPWLSAPAIQCNDYYFILNHALPDYPATDNRWKGFVTIPNPVCPDGKKLDKSGEMCVRTDSNSLGAPPEDACVGNPINIAVGNKFQHETDFSSNAFNGLSFSRYYNSADGIWRHNYSALMKFYSERVSIVDADGRESFFTLQGGIWVPERLNETATLVRKDDNWIYTRAEGERSTFSGETGRLVEQYSPLRGVASMSYNDGYFKVTDQNGQSFIFSEDSRHQPLTFSVSGLNITYKYNASKNLIQVVRSRGKLNEVRSFHYEDARNTFLLTGITDERGVRFATWTYDSKGRAITSQHAGGAGLTQVAYYDDGSSTVTNELGKQTTYKYVEIDGTKRVSEIVGEPSPNCPASNSKYAYDQNGRLRDKVDAKGLLTTYEYNSQGLESKRVEAAGTPAQRVTETKWHPTFLLPVEISDGTRITTYLYDSQGRPLSREVQAPNTEPVSPPSDTPITLPPRVN